MTGKTRTILLADDDADDLELLNELLLFFEPSLKILLANTGKEAIKMLAQPADGQLPSLVIIDYNMPDFTGAQVIATIAEDARYTGVPKIIWSTSDASLYEQICKANGATHYFKKPDNIDEIQHLAQKILSL
jgi:CheY-like chemotaxis protein